MQNMRPLVFLILSFLLLSVGTFIGSRIRNSREVQIEEEAKIIAVIEGSLLTLLGLLIGFTCSMAVSRYDVRVQLIVKEANAIGATRLRSSTLDEPARTQTQQLLRQYLSTRYLFLASGHNDREFQRSLSGTSGL